MLSPVVRSNTYFDRMWSQFVACPLPVPWWNLLFLFFLLQSQAKDEHLTFTERAMLLGIAVKWFSNSTDSQLQKTPAELKELQKNRWLFRIRAEIEKDYEVRGVMFPVATPRYYVACNQSYFAGNFIIFNNILTSLSRLIALVSFHHRLQNKMYYTFIPLVSSRYRLKTRFITCTFYKNFWWHYSAFRASWLIISSDTTWFRAT